VFVSKWEGKYVIGLTGNIGTGKSVVRRMLGHLGAFGIDADSLAHRAISRGSSGYQQVVDLFGSRVKGSQGEIDRSRLGKIVFSDPDALAQLENIIHPIVTRTLDRLIKRAPQAVIVIEAIKLLEAGYGSFCDSIWVVYAPFDVQLSRLTQNRHMSEIEARQRINTQSPQEEKISASQVVIKNHTSFENTWDQVLIAWDATVPLANTPSLNNFSHVWKQGKQNDFLTTPRRSQEIADFLNTLKPTKKKLSVKKMIESHNG
jgi:dephospho-CoA kinase